MKILWKNLNTIMLGMYHKLLPLGSFLLQCKTAIQIIVVIKIVHTHTHAHTKIHEICFIGSFYQRLFKNFLVGKILWNVKLTHGARTFWWTGRLWYQWGLEDGSSSASCHEPADYVPLPSSKGCSPGTTYVGSNRSGKPQRRQWQWALRGRVSVITMFPNVEAANSIPVDNHKVEGLSCHHRNAFPHALLHWDSGF